LPLKPSYLLLTGAGAIVAYSGLKGKGIGAVARQIISGQSPQSVPQQLSSLIKGAPVSQTGGGSPSGSGVVQSAPTPTGSEVSWITAFLIAVGAPPTSANIHSVSAWIAHEGDFATSGNNALNTTQSNSDSIGTKNSIGVQIFRTPSGGVNANATALLNGLYGDVLSALRSGQGLCGQNFHGLSTWSGGGYSSVC
jgi:hypothetical protein